MGSKDTNTTPKPQGSVFSADLLNKTLKEKFKYRIVEYCISHLCTSILLGNKEKATRLILNDIPI